MYLRDLVKSLLRRWYLVLVALLVVAGLGLVTYQQVPATYSARASVVLLPPKNSIEPGANPYLYLGGLGQALDVLTRSINADTTQDPILARNPGATYVASPDGSSGPILAVDTTAPTAEGALAVLNDVLTAVPVDLIELQNQLGIVSSQQITSLELTVDQRATTSGRSRLRAVVAVVAIGVAGMALLIGLVDGLLLGRKKAKESKGTPDEVKSHRPSRGQERLKRPSRARLDKRPRAHERPAREPEAAENRRTKPDDEAPTPSPARGRSRITVGPKDNLR